tara:strand:+ start:287 stop:448 length:162 start_codon:yes stop_codon:yes gene_type:complete
MKWLPLTIAIVVLILAVVFSRYLPESFDNAAINELDESPVKNAVGTIRPEKEK